MHQKSEEEKNAVLDRQESDLSPLASDKHNIEIKCLKDKLIHVRFFENMNYLYKFFRQQGNQKMNVYKINL